jgi:hypothetical protein
MIRLLAGSGLVMSIMIRSAAADFYFQLPDGRYLVVPDGLVLLGVLVFVVIAGGLVAGTLASKGDRESLPDEIGSPQSSEYYDDQAARMRALKRKLDAETDLAESYINAKRTRAELDELPEILGHDKARRRR